MCARRSARNASASHKANHIMKSLYLYGNEIGDDGAVALADAVKALLMMLCFLWNSPSILVTRMNTASLPTCSLTRKEAHFRHNLEHVVSRETSATAWQRGGTYVQMKCTSCAVASCLRC